MFERDAWRPSIQAAILIVAFNGPLSAADKVGRSADGSADPTEVPEGKASLHRMLDESAGRYMLYAGTERGESLKLRCVLRWANVTRGSVDGATYIWTADGRPLATVCVYPFAGQLCDNFQSLAEGAVTAWVDGQPVWRCEKPGLDYQPVADAPAPAETAAGRLRQMKSLAERFSTRLMGWNADDSDREALRMLPRPVYRYGSEKSMDGAIFAFVQGTDPEAFLLLETRPDVATRSESLIWHFAMARRTSGWLETTYDGQPVWTAERLFDYSDPKRPYFQAARPLSLVKPSK